VQATLNIQTGAMGAVRVLWNGTGGASPEGPHVYRKDGYYYLMIAEGGTELGHSETIARSRTLEGPYKPYEKNPILINPKTAQYFQTVGHADLFQDDRGNWWGVALSKRSGPECEDYHMGREMVLFSATWETGQEPVLTPVQGEMRGWQLPTLRKIFTGENAFVDDPDEVDFAPGSAIPGHVVFWRLPNETSFTVSPSDHAHALRLSPSMANLTAYDDWDPTDGLTIIGRRQTDTKFTFEIDVEFYPTVQGEEFRATVFLTQSQRLDLGIVLLPPSSKKGSSKLELYFRFRATGIGNAKEASVPASILVPVPKSCACKSKLSTTSFTNSRRFRLGTGIVK
jgi:beta-xylosidase